MSKTRPRPRAPIASTNGKAKKSTALPTSPAVGARVYSLDALRGFNMFWIIGGEEFVSQIAKRWNNPIFNEVSANLTSHVDWQGFHFYDMIFPLFLFVIGVALPFSMARRRAQGETRRQMAWKIVKRTIILFFLGWLYYGFLEFRGLDHMRIMGVLQRLALGYGVAALIMLFTSIRGQAIAAGALLVVYWLAMRFLPVPGYGHGDFSQYGNFANYLDRVIFLPGQLYEKYGDPEGLFSTIPAVATALLGVLTGHWLRRPEKPTWKITVMFLTGVASIIAGYIWSLDFPVIKKIWTSSYVLVAGGWSLLILTLFYWLIDVRGWRKWAFPFVVIGLNPITIYVGQRIIDFDGIAGYFVKGALHYIPAMAPILFALSVLIVKWLFLYFLYRKQMILRV